MGAAARYLGLILSLALGLAASSWAAEPLSGLVVGVVDGDTITLRGPGGPVTVRLASVDAPERHQAYGQAARQALADRVLQHPARVAVQGHDAYGRLIGVVTVEGQAINLQMVREGWAWAYRKYLGRDGADYLAAEAAARKDRRGLWRDPAPQPPWEFRHGGPAPGSRGALEAMAERQARTNRQPSADGSRLFADAPEWESRVSGSAPGADRSAGADADGRGPWHTGRRGGQYTLTPGGNRNYAPRR